MQKAISAIDDLNDLGSRLIVFEDDETNPHRLTIIKFPDNRGTILFDGKLYDWYGREVIISDKIKRVVTPFGHYTDGKDLYHCHDNFIVELTTGEYAIPGIRYRRFAYSSPDYSGLKYAITAGAYNMLPHLELDDSPRFESIEPDALSGTCFEIFKRYYGNASYAIGKNPIIAGSPRKGVSSLINGESAIDNHRQWFSIAESRESILETVENQSGRMDNPDLYLSMDEFCGEIEVSENGDKLTAVFPVKHFSDQTIRASTDKEVLSHMKRSGFWWYLDKH
ncbi:hypothetical protein IJS18_03200 [Candidatus Saccharibacteria bacterium]|nr:hypothetical protein [Candidatus Saccharibacteria bacterium]